MSIQPGQSLLHYRIVEKIGEGGMGMVWRAEDSKLKRSVALKVLPAEMAADAERRQRFERETEAIAALNHPNIVTIYSVEQVEDVHFFTMELVEGGTLTELISRQGLPLAKFFSIAVPLSDALAAAHEQGILHRDLKPDNVMLDKAGRVKVLDFGLAKLRQETAPAAEATAAPTASVTGEGRVLGTVSYMSPEQAEAKPVDQRSDIFSLGIVLYEMATGLRPFRGDTKLSTLTSILRDQPTPITDLNQSLPRHLERIVRHCLHKDPERRCQTAKQLRNELEELKEEIVSGVGTEAVPVRPKPLHRGRTLAGLAVAAVALTAAGYWISQWTDVSPDVPSAATMGEFTKLTDRPGEELFPDLSPEGRSFIYMSLDDGDWNIFLQRVGGTNPINLTADSEGDDGPGAFSPDGEFIAFASERDGGGIFVMGATGESVRRLTDFGDNPSWSPDGEEIVFATRRVVASPAGRSTQSELWVVDVAGGKPARIEENDAVHPAWSPNGHRIAFWGIVEGGNREIWTVPAGGGERVRVTDEPSLDWNPVWSPDGAHLYFASNRGGTMNLWRVPIDERTGRLLGEPETVTSGASVSAFHPSFSAGGQRLLYVSRLAELNLHKVRLDPLTGTTEGAPVPITRGSTQVDAPAVSPDGEWLAYVRIGTREDLFVMRLDGSERRQLTDDLFKDRLPHWTSDGERLVFYSDRSGSYEAWSIRPDGSDMQALTDTPQHSVIWPDVSPDGSLLAYSALMQGKSYIRDLRDGKTLEIPPVDETGDTFEPYAWSPNGRWLAGQVFTSDREPRGVFLRDVETGEFRQLTDHGNNPIWLHDGRRLLFWSEGKLFLLDSETGASHELLSIERSVIGTQFDVSPNDDWVYFRLSTAESDIWSITQN